VTTTEPASDFGGAAGIDEVIPSKVFWEKERETNFLR